MTGQDGGFRAAAARFKAEVEAARHQGPPGGVRGEGAVGRLPPWHRRADEPGKTGRLRGSAAPRSQPTSPDAREDATKFRTANDLPVEDLPDADELTRRPAPAEAPPPQARGRGLLAAPGTVSTSTRGTSPPLPRRRREWTRPPMNPRAPGSIHQSAPSETRTRTFRNSESSSTRPSNPTVRMPCRAPVFELAGREKPQLGRPVAGIAPASVAAGRGSRRRTGPYATVTDPSSVRRSRSQRPAIRWRQPGTGHGRVYVARGVRTKKRTTRPRRMKGAAPNA